MPRHLGGAGGGQTGRCPHYHQNFLGAKRCFRTFFMVSGEKKLSAPAEKCFSFPLHPEKFRRRSLGAVSAHMVPDGPTRLILRSPRLLNFTVRTIWMCSKYSTLAPVGQSPTSMVKFFRNRPLSGRGLQNSSIFPGAPADRQFKGLVQQFYANFFHKLSYQRNPIHFKQKMIRQVR